MKYFIDFEELIYAKTTEVKSPIRGHENDAGIDFFVPNNFEKVTLLPNEDIKIDSGIRVIVPNNWAFIFKEKSGIATNRKLTCGAAVIDAGYRGNVHFHLFNNGTEPQTIEAGDKITQALIIPVSLCQPKEISLEEYEEMYNDTSRGSKGFGSTGTK